MSRVACLSLPEESLPPPDLLTAALCAAELGEPFDFTRVAPDELREFFAAVPSLRVTVPFATLRLLSRLGNDERKEVRAATARALGAFVDWHPPRVEELLLPLACDPSGRVRHAAAETLARLISASADPWQVIETWQAHPDRARAALKEARRSLPHPLGT
jgi:hypothetical protein